MEAATPTLPPWLLLISLTIAVVSILLLKVRRHRPLPPGPSPWPLVGNIPHLLLHKKRQPLHAILASLSRTHGRDLLHLRLGTKTFIVASSPAAASEVLRTHDRALSSRNVPACYLVPIYSDHSYVWSTRCDERWRSLRSLFHSGLFSSGSLGDGTLLREAKASAIVKLLKEREGREVVVADVVFDVVLDLFWRTMFSRDLVGDQPEGKNLEIRRGIKRGLEIGIAPNLEDFFPGLLRGWDIHGFRRQVSSIIHTFYDLWEEIIVERKREKSNGVARTKGDFLDIMLLHGLDGFQLKALLSDLLVAGTETTSTSIEWTMSELIKNHTAMSRLKGELALSGGILRESHLLSLPYLQACIKESLRLHPPAPLLLPRRASETCELMGYVIPEGAVVLVNAWNIGRDPGIWEEPLAFRPERFLGSRGCRGTGDIEMVPFGLGRRGCPGFALAYRIISFAIASLVGNFEWSLPREMDPSELSMEEKASISVGRKHPLVAIPKSIA